ncbi:STOREKEEPER protein [Manihot esculenta]|uniref:Glabrous enhancer-binding protein-like DBD domain-containing protein n=1 Tax=Manihot esculenta TaxID=3983 RepID=A0A251JMP0_MANES|nr:STOREKEEPER protein [Manihot esculenta]OAY35154.1 hypothetical protein MANES_12G076500v8 [Manihot esculenta]
MAIKRLSENPPPAASSSEEEEEEENDSVEKNDSEDEQKDVGDGDDDEEEQQESPVLNKSTVHGSPLKYNSASESDSESTQPSPSPSAFTIKLHKPSSKPNKSVSKRPAESDCIAGETPRKKKNKAIGGGDDEEVKKGSAIQRLWSEDDEIAILNGLSQYKSEKGSNPYADMGDFHEFIKKSLHVDVSKNQLMDKIRRLKKKYRDNIEKAENGRDPVFSKPHDLKSFELSKKFWDGDKNYEKNGTVNRSGKVNSSNDGGGSGGGDGGVRITLALACQKKGNELKARKQMQTSNKQVKIEENHQVKAEEMMQEKGEDVEEELWEKYPYLSESLEMGGLSEGAKVILRQQLGIIEKGKLKELDEKRKRLKQAELELFVQRMELAHEQVKLTLDSIKSEES